jgi:hypothetical protein
MATRHSAITTIGIDGHRAEDIERFGRDQALGTRTIGQTARLIERVKPDLAWSNLAA